MFQTPRKIILILVLAFTLFFAFQHLLFEFPPQSDAYRESLRQHDPFQGLERWDYDVHLRAHKISPPHPDIAVIQINEPSIQAYGQFPFSRGLYVELLTKLKSLGAKVLAFDMVFSEKERNETYTVLQTLRQELQAKNSSQTVLRILENKIHGVDGDANLAAKIAKEKMPLVLGLTFSDPSALLAGAKNIEAKNLRLLRNYQLKVRDIQAGEIGENRSNSIPLVPELAFLEALPKNIVSLGNFSTNFDSDSVIRRAPLVTEYQNGFFPSLSVSAVAAYAQTNFTLLKQGREFWLESGDQKIRVPISRDGDFYPKFYGSKELIPIYEMVDVMKGRYDQDLRGKIVFLGVTAVGLKDIRATPYTANYPGVAVHATIASNILQGDYIVKSGLYYKIGYLWILLFGVLLGLLAFYKHPALASLLTGLAIFAIDWMGQRFFFDRGQFVPTFYPALLYATLLFAGILYRYISQEREKKFVREALSRYVSSAVADEILKDPTKLSLGGHKKELSVFFCDIVGFTRLSETIDAALLSQLLNQFFTRMTALILKNQGTLDKYMGDAIMCFWGAPLENKDHAKFACRATLEILQEIDLIHREWLDKYSIDIKLRIGVNTGEMAVGNMGSEQIFSYTVLGDNVNLASRLEEANNLYGTRVLVGEKTYEQARDEFCFRHLDTVFLKGKENPVKLYELVDYRSNEGLHAPWINCYTRGLASYKSGDWAEAMRQFGLCLDLRPDDTASRVMISRMELNRD